MWKTLKKIIPSANIHAAGSRYMLRSASSSVNPSNYIKEGNERSDVFSLVLFANSLKRENQKLSKLCGNTTYSEATKNAYRLQIEANESQLGSYIRQLERDFENQGDLPADALAGFVSLVAGGNVLTQEYLNIHLKADLLSKIEFASLEALTELAEALEILGFDRSSDISSEVHTTLSHRLDVT